MSIISERKRRRREPQPAQTASGKTFTRKNPQVKSPIPEGTYQLPTWPYPLDLSVNLHKVLLPFTDPIKASDKAYLKALAGNLLGKYGVKDKGK